MRSPWKLLAASRPDATTPAPAPLNGPLPGFEDPGAWRSITSGEATLSVRGDAGQAFRLDYDFHGSGGFVVARREIRLGLPEAYSIRMRFRGSGPANDLEWKWVDAQGASVWRHVRRITAWPGEWTPLEVRSSEIPFAWGPAGGGLLLEVSAIEIAIVAREGGCGSVWLKDVALVDRTVRDEPVYSTNESSWMADYRGEREFGGLAIRWTEAPSPAFVVETSPDGITWQEMAGRGSAASSLSLLSVGPSVTRFLRLRCEPPTALASVELVPVEAGESRDSPFYLLAQMAPRGWFPRYWLREQSYWTPIAPPSGTPRGLMNEEGLVEPSAGLFSLEPFLWDEGRLVTWEDVQVGHRQEEGWMPVPNTVWNRGFWRLHMDAGATEDGFVVRYRLENLGPQSEKLRLFVALRPFQATPPWQAFRQFGGLGRVEALSARGEDRVVTGEGTIICVEPSPAGFGAMASADGILVETLASGRLPEAQCVEDPAGLASGAFAWDLRLEPGKSAIVQIRVNCADGVVLENAEALWHESAVANAWRIEGGTAETTALALAMRAATAHVLVNRDGPALHPGPRRYDRCWIRDAAGMARALLQAGCRDAVRDLLEWYAPYIREDGTVPCCVDGDGPDWLPEYDSQGQFPHIVAEFLRYGGDRTVVERLWPVVLRTIDRLADLRASRMTAAFQAGNPPHRFGLLPESASHEGYLAHPVHSYWDDFWAMRGLDDVAWLAGELGDMARFDALAALRDSFRQTLAASLEGLIRERELDFVPGSVEWADYDPSATANGLTLLEELPGVSGALLGKTFARYLERFRARRDETVPWDNYSPYEIRIVGALLLLGWRDEALEVLLHFLGDRRPGAWNQWPEIAWHDPRSPGHVGDIPHTWIAAEFVSAARAIFVSERHRDGSLVIGEGLPEQWWREAGGIALRDWPTEHGPLRCSLRLERPGLVVFELEAGLRVPPGGVRLAVRLPGALLAWRVNGVPCPVPAEGWPVVSECPALAELEFSMA